MNTWLLPDLGLVPCSHGEPVEPGVPDPADEPRRVRPRTEAKHSYRRRRRAHNLRVRHVPGWTGSSASNYDSDDPVPF